VIIQSEGLNKKFRGHDALRGISLAVPEGNIYALIGANGAGKTTTIKTLLNLLAPTSGRAEVLGIDTRQLSARDFARIGYVSENQELPLRLSVGAYLGFLRPFYPTWDEELERSLVSELRLPTERKIRDLSHGMRMKVGLACALSFRPKLLVLDEPFSGLDPLVKDELMSRLLSQADEMTVFLSSHELDEIEASTTYVGYLENGRLLFQEPMSSLAARVREVRVTLEHPATVPVDPPAHWIDLLATGNVLTFFDLAHEPESLRTSLNSLFSGIRSVDARPAALRSIFTALARTSSSRRVAR